MGRQECLFHDPLSGNQRRRAESARGAGHSCRRSVPPTDAESIYCRADSLQAEHQDWGTLTLREPPISHPPQGEGQADLCCSVPKTRRRSRSGSLPTRIPVWLKRRQSRSSRRGIRMVPRANPPSRRLPRQRRTRHGALVVRYIPRYETSCRLPAFRLETRGRDGRAVLDCILRPARRRRRELILRVVGRCGG